MSFLAKKKGGCRNNLLWVGGALRQCLGSTRDPHQIRESPAKLLNGQNLDADTIHGVVDLGSLARRRHTDDPDDITDGLVGILHAERMSAVELRQRRGGLGGLDPTSGNRQDHHDAGTPR